MPHNGQISEVLRVQMCLGPMEHIRNRPDQAAIQSNPAQAQPTCTDDPNAWRWEGAGGIRQVLKGKSCVRFLLSMSTVVKSRLIYIPKLRVESADLVVYGQQR